MNVLITGANSYIGTSFARWMKKFTGYKIDTIGTLNDEWVKKDFSNYDVLFHVAGLAHQRETKNNAYLYYKVNRDLAIAVAEKARNSGVKQFILLSSMSVYGLLHGTISSTTPTNPNTNYGKSKLEAERYISKMSCDNFKIAILRPPMVYGDNCKGNYHFLEKFALKFPVFPYIENQRSMVYIDTLCAFVKKIIDMQEEGLFFPQDDEYVCTSDMVKKIAMKNGKKIKFTKIFNPLIFLFKKFKIVQKVFGDLTYDKNL